MQTKFFIYVWGISPLDSNLIGPFDTLEAALSWGEDHPDDRPEQAGIVALPFISPRGWTDDEEDKR